MSKSKKEIKDRQGKELQKIPGMVEGFALTRRLSTLADIILQLDAASNKEEIYHILRKEYKWLFECEVFLVAILNPRHTNYQIISLSSVVDVTGLNGNYFHTDEGILGWVIKSQSPVICNINDCPKHSNSIEGKLEELGI